jgi:glycosyltransferase involved in cell wall biosynthesis
METPQVTIICICYNQERFVEEAIKSVFDQTYQKIQLIVMDDGSTDGSAIRIKNSLVEHPEVLFIHHASNMGYTKTLNEAVALATGEFIIDLAADDVLLPNRVKVGVTELERAGSEFGVHFSDGEIMNEAGIFLRNHSDRFPHHAVPQGDVYLSLISTYFILSPTIMYRKKVIESIGGYDPDLAFEDFDFLVRASRNFLFCYSPQALIRKRIVKGSLSDLQFRRGSKQRWSTLKVCEKILKLNKNAAEHIALKKRVRYESLLSLRQLDIRLALAFLKFYLRLSSPATILK